MERETFVRDGAVLLPGLFDAAALEPLLSIPPEGPGLRLHTGIAPVIAPATAAASRLLGSTAFPVRAVLFNKTPDSNWIVAWHQDRTIPVTARIETPGFGPWSRKDGLLHVMPPVSVLERMATLRIHLDDVGTDNAPLRVALGSHRLGLTVAREAAFIAAKHEIIECRARRGDVWAYSTPILHASERSRIDGERRVLQVDYATEDLPDGLHWVGVS